MSTRQQQCQMEEPASAAPKSQPVGAKPTPGRTLRFSIVVPFRNSKRFLDGCIRSLLRQTFPKDQYEILLVDNGSTDGSRELAGRWQPAVRVLHEPRVGSYAARNLGLDHASGEVIAFIDSDCEADPGWLAALDQALGDPRIGVVLGHRQYPPAAPPLKWLEAFERHKAEWVFGLSEGVRYYGHTNNMAVRASLFDEIGRFAEVQRGADTLWVQKAVRQLSPQTVCFAAAVLVRHMEMTSLALYCRKKWLYGRSAHRYRAGERFNRPFSRADRMHIYRRTVAAERYGRLQASALLFFLILGGLSYSIAARLPRLSELTVQPREQVARSP
jgi:glycosyltransferase involved in cell wall biosynthesis